MPNSIKCFTDIAENDPNFFNQAFQENYSKVVSKLSLWEGTKGGY
jgi:hypothetical protein